MNKILLDLDNELYNKSLYKISYQFYKSQLNVIYNNFTHIYNILLSLHNNVKEQTMCGMKNDINFKILNPLIQKLDIVANSLSNNFITFQGIIDANHIMFTHLKLLDAVALKQSLDGQ